MGKILVVEDSNEIMAAASGFIGNGHSIIQMDADSGPDRLLSEEKIDIALIEISDTFNSRYDLIQAILDLNQEVKILLVVDSNLFDLVRPLLTDDLFDYLIKPIDTYKLRKKVNLPTKVDLDIEFTGLLSKIATEIAHRIKNPLTTVKTFTSLLKERFDDPEFRDAFYRSTSREIERINEIIERLISYSTFGKPILAPADLDLIMKDVTNSLMSYPNYRNIRILTDPDGYIPSVLIDGIQMRLILENILLFVSKDMREGGEIRMRRLRSSLRLKDQAKIEISYPFRREGIEGKDLFVVDLLLAKEAIGYQGGELNVRISNREVKVIDINLPCCTGIELVIRSDFISPSKRPSPNERGSRILNYYDRRRYHLPIQFSERRINERRRENISLCLPEKRRILAVFTHL